MEFSKASKLLFSTIAVSGVLLTPGISSAATSRYEVIHNFSVSYRDAPICVALFPSPCINALRTSVRADAFASWGPFPTDVDAPPSDTTKAFLPCLPGQSCSLASYAENEASTHRSWSSSTAEAFGSLTHLDPTFGRASGHSHVTGVATAINPSPRTRSYASASSEASVTFLNGRFRNGRFYWQPIVTSRASGKTSSVRWNDPLSYEIMDGNSVTEQGDLLSIIYEGSDLSSKSQADFSWPDITSSNPLLSLSFPGDGIFSIDLTNDYVSNPGFLKLQASKGTWSAIEKSGRFNALSVPNIGEISAWSIPLLDLYGTNPSGCSPDVGPDAVSGFCVDTNFSGIPSSYNINYRGGGSGFAEAAEEVPAPLAFVGLGIAARSIRKLKNLSDKLNLPL